MGQWDGAIYGPRAALPATVDDEGTVRWMRTTFELDPTAYFDYQAAVVGTNVLLQLSTPDIVVHRIEATRL